MALEDSIKREIRHNGPMTLARFMALASAHYYGSRDPFGKDGDFTTAPEISQMFGEMIGAWAADCWAQMGRPEKFYLVECGPGRGTLMADALRAVRGVPGFTEAADIRLVEMSEVLREKQEAALKGQKVRWSERIEDVPNDAPLLLLANEFLDALPVRQFVFADGAWQEKVIGLGPDDTLEWGLVPADALSGSTEGEVAEISDAVFQFAQQVGRRIAEQGGAALFIDYGYAQGRGDTVQAMRRHEFVPVLSHVGEADITAHVDFAALARAGEGAEIFGPVTQGAFLQRLGIAQRAAMLRQTATEEQAADIDAALLRLTDAAHMGELFKVMAYVGKGIKPAGF